ncbi:MAG: ABC transporter permease [Malacoplasma sp.]
MEMFNFMKIKKDEFLFKNKNRANRKNIYIVVAFIAIALFVSLIIVQLFGYNFGSAFTHLFSQSFSPLIYKDLIYNFSIFGLAALAFAFAYKSGLFNIGISGQMMGAGLGVIAFAKIVQPSIAESSVLGQYAVIYTILIAVLVGAFIAGFTGLLKIFFNVHEVVSSILINWIVFFLTKFLISDNSLLGNADKSTHSYEVSNDFALYDPSQNSGFIAAIVIFLVCALVVWALLKFTVFGKKIKSVGLSKSASFYAGYNTKSLQMGAFMISGVIAGLLAVVVYTGTAEKAIPIPQITALPTYGFDGIALGLIAFSNPIAIIPVTFFMSIIKTSSDAGAPFPGTLANMILGIIMYGTAIFTVFYTFKPIEKLKVFLRRKSSKYGDTYYVNKYEDDKVIRINKIETLLAKRKTKLFVEWNKLKKEKIEKMNLELNWFVKIKLNFILKDLKKDIVRKNNDIYFNEKKEIPLLSLKSKMIYYKDLYAKRISTNNADSDIKGGN